MLKSEDSYTDAVTEGQSSSREHKRHAETARVSLECKCLHTFLMELCPWKEAGSMMIVSFGLFLLPHLSAALVIHLVGTVLAPQGFIKW